MKKGYPAIPQLNPTNIPHHTQTELKGKPYAQCLFFDFGHVHVRPLLGHGRMRGNFKLYSFCTLNRQIVATITKNKNEGCRKN